MGMDFFIRALVSNQIYTYDIKTQVIYITSSKVDYVLDSHQIFRSYKKKMYQRLSQK